MKPLLIFRMKGFDVSERHGQPLSSLLQAKSAHQIGSELVRANTRLNERIGPVSTSRELLPDCPFERSRWRGGRYACDTPDIMGWRSVLNRLSPLFANLLSFSMLQAKIDSIPIA